MGRTVRWAFLTTIKGSSQRIHGHRLPGSVRKFSVDGSKRLFSFPLLLEEEDFSPHYATVLAHQPQLPSQVSISLGPYRLGRI